MRVIVLGLGVQGHKRQRVAGPDCIGTVDPVNMDARWKRVEDVPVGDYDAALVCTPDEPKLEVLGYLLQHGKHVLVEKPLFAPTDAAIAALQALARANKAVCYTAYNHRFEPHFVRMRVLPSGRPPEESVTLVQDDPTWALEYAHFKTLCAAPAPDLSGDLFYNRVLRALGDAALSKVVR